MLSLFCFVLFYLFAFCFLIYVKKTLKEIFTYFIYFKKNPLKLPEAW